LIVLQAHFSGILLCIYCNTTASVSCILLPWPSLAHLIPMYQTDSISPSTTLGQLSMGQSTLEGNTICQPNHVNGARYYGPCFDLHSGGILAHPYSRSQLIHSPPLTHRMMQFYMGSPIFHWTDPILAHLCYSV